MKRFIKKNIIHNETLFFLTRRVWRAYLHIPHALENIQLKKFLSPDIIYTHDNFLILIDPINGRVDEQIFLHKKWESELCAHIKSLLKEDSVFVDVGGNIGYISLFAAKHVPAGAVHYFEPIPRLVAQTKKSIDQNNYDNITQYNFACGTGPGTETLYIDQGNVGKSGMYTSGETSLEISVDSLDNLLDHLQRIDVIKIDVEGYELSALQGMSQIINNHNPYIFIEFSPTLYQDPTDAEKIIDLLLLNHYKITDIYLNKTYTSMNDIDMKFLKKNGQTDFLCTPTHK